VELLRRYLAEIFLGVIVAVAGGILLAWILPSLAPKALVPNVQNMTRGSAEIALRNEGIPYFIVEIPGTRKDIIVSQSPPPGVERESGQPLVLSLETGVPPELLKDLIANGAVAAKIIKIPSGTTVDFSLKEPVIVGGGAFEPTASGALTRAISSDQSLVAAVGASVLIDVSEDSTMFTRTVKLRPRGIVTSTGEHLPISSNPVVVKVGSGINAVLGTAMLMTFVALILGLLLDALFMFMSLGLAAITFAVIGFFVGIAMGFGAVDQAKTVSLSRGTNFSTELSTSQEVTVYRETRNQPSP
jgi:hypothetical protein